MRTLSLLVLWSTFLGSAAVAAPVRARDLGVPFDGRPGRFNAITDVPGVLVGHTTLISGKSSRAVRARPVVRTGVTAILPRGKRYDPVLAGWFSMNGDGEMTGTTRIDATGCMDGPVCITNTLSVGAVHQGVVRWLNKHRLYDHVEGLEAVPVVAETWDAWMNDMAGQHVKARHVFGALDRAKSGPVAEGSVGGGTGMKAFSFKAGIGTSSRVLGKRDGGYTVGVILQANFGARRDLTVAGVPVGRKLNDLWPIINERPKETKHNEDRGSCIVVVATDAPLLPHQLKAMAKRVAIGLARTGNTAHYDSGEIFLALSTANPHTQTTKRVTRLEALPNCRLDALYEATIQATEEAIINSLVAAKTMDGVNGNRFYAIPHDRLQSILDHHHRLVRAQAARLAATQRAPRATGAHAP